MRILPFLCLFVLLSCQDESTNEKTISENENIEKKFPLVTVHVVEKQSFNHFQKIQGSVISKDMAYIRPEIQGTVMKIHVKEGDYVIKNQKLLTLSNAVLNAQLAEIDQNLSFASFLYRKQMALFNEGVATEIQFKEAENGMESLNKARNTLLTQLGKTTILSPFSGYVETTMIQLGEAVSPASPAFHLVGTSNLYLTADVSENLLSEISINNPVVAYFPSINETVEGLKLTRIGKLVNPTNRTVKIEAILKNKTTELIPNLMGEIHINDYSIDSAICLSSRTILKNAYGETFVKTLNAQNKVVTCSIKLGKQEGQLIEVLGGLRVGTIVIDQGKSTVLEGQEVRVINTPPFKNDSLTVNEG
jgi:RND family efflux transporter MFP subunit